ncbi:MAG: glycoside hydrolase family 2 TIM barrel-domain containing protein [Planctomycetota bacterium]
MKMLACILVVSQIIGFAGLAFGQREVSDFNDSWEFIKTDVAAADAGKALSDWAKVTLPHTWNDKDAQSGDAFYAGTGCYRKKLFVDASQKGRRFFLRFEGVGQVADVFVNDLHAGNHKGAYSAFCLEITPALKYGQENLIVVKANNQARPDIIPVNHQLFMVFGGIYRPVSLIVTDKIHITPRDYASPGVYIRQKDVSKKSALIDVKTKLENGHTVMKELTVKTTIKNADGKKVASEKDTFKVRPVMVTSVQQELKVRKPRLWNGRHDPYLYQLVVEVFDGDRLVDSVTQPLGIRYYSMDPDKGFILNGKPYRLYGVCRHQEWQDCGSALSNQQHKEDFDTIYEIGATAVRLAHYQQADYVYSYCDQSGIVVWAEIPFVSRKTEQEGYNAKQQMRELVRQNYNHPSIFMWGLHNEVMARDAMDSPVLVTRELHDIAKSEDPDRWTVSVTGYGSLDRPMSLHADLQGCNRYYGWYYGQIEDITTWIEGTKKSRPDNFVCLAEYGAGANIAHQEENPKKPNAISGKFYPEQFQTNIHEIQWPAIESHPFIWSSYVWNMFDFAVPKWNRGGIKGRNHKGLITYDRSTRKDSFYYYKANWSDEPVLHIRDRRLTERTNPRPTVKVYSNCGMPEVKINGVKAEVTSAGYAVYTCHVTLVDGENVVEAAVSRDGKQYTDSCTWTFDAAKAKAIAKAEAEKVVIASSVESAKPSVPENTLDGDLQTYWSTNERNPWIRYALVGEKKLGKIGIAWYNGSERVYPFEVEFSFDGHAWEQVYQGKSGGVDGIEFYEFNPKDANFVRICCHANSVNEYSAICEVEIEGLKKTE